MVARDFPGLVIVLIALCVNFIGDGLRDAFDPQQTSPCLSPSSPFDELTVEFKTEDGIVHAVDEVSFDVYPGEMLGIVGESGRARASRAGDPRPAPEAAGRIV